MKRKTSRIATVLTSGIPTPQFVGIQTARYAGGYRWKSRSVRLVADERSKVYCLLGPARSFGPRYDDRSSGEEHSDPGPMRTTIQVHGILTGQNLHRAPIDTLLDAAFLLQVPFKFLESSDMQTSRLSGRVPPLSPRCAVDAGEDDDTLLCFSRKPA